ncbi:hypothetical protein Tco_1265332 [Tanacetum coccineum]
MIAEEKIFVDYICILEDTDTSVEDITSIFRFKGEDYIVEKPKICASSHMTLETLEVKVGLSEGDLLRITTFRDPAKLMKSELKLALYPIRDPDETDEVRVEAGSSSHKVQFLRLPCGMKSQLQL